MVRVALMVLRLAWRLVEYVAPIDRRSAPW